MPQDLSEAAQDHLEAAERIGCEPEDLRGIGRPPRPLSDAGAATALAQRLAQRSGVERAVAVCVEPFEWWVRLDRAEVGSRVDGR